MPTTSKRHALAQFDVAVGMLDVIAVRMTVDVDKTRGQAQAASVDDAGGLTVQMGGHGDEAAVGHGHIAQELLGAGAVDDGRPADEQIVHVHFLPTKPLACQQLCFRTNFMLTSKRDSGK